MGANDFRAILARFTGTTAYYRHWSGLRYTEGVRFLAKEASCYWLLDVIASRQGEALADPWLREFQLWEVFVKPDSTSIVCSRDSDDEAFRQEIEFTDFCLDYVRLYVERGVILLPSEH